MDPFNDVEDDAWQQINVLQALVNTDPITENTKLDYTNSFQELEEIINDLTEALEVSEANPEQFELTSFDVSDRHKTLNKLQNTKADIQATWNGKLNDPRRQRQITTMSNRISQDENPFADNNRIDNEFQRYQEQELIRDQDLQLDSIHLTMQNLNQQAMIMGGELEDQGTMLDELEGDLDRVDNRLQRGIKRVNWIIEKNRERGSDWCIGILVVALVILLILIIAI